MDYAREEGPFSIFGLESCVDETLPPGVIKMLAGEEAQVFLIEPDTDRATLIARWPERTGLRDPS